MLKKSAFTSTALALSTREKQIQDLLLEDEAFVKGIDNLFKNKQKKKVFFKAAEECVELATRLLQEANNPDKVEDDKLLEEVVDVQMHLLLIQRYFEYRLKENMIDKKISKFLESKDYKKYSNEQRDRI